METHGNIISAISSNNIKWATVLFACDNAPKVLAPASCVTTEQYLKHHDDMKTPSCLRQVTNKWASYKANARQCQQPHGQRNHYNYWIPTGTLYRSNAVYQPSEWKRAPKKYLYVRKLIAHVTPSELIQCAFNQPRLTAFKNGSKTEKLLAKKNEWKSFSNLLYEVCDAIPYSRTSH